MLVEAKRQWRHDTGISRGCTAPRRFLLILIIIVFPIAYTGYISLTNMNLYHWAGLSEVIGLANYVRALFKFDSGFLAALCTTLLVDGAEHGHAAVLRAFWIALGLNAQGSAPAAACIRPC